MNGFKFYKKFENKNINYKILSATENAIEFVMNYPNDIWGSDDCDTKCYKKIILTRSEWSEIKNYFNYMNAVDDFKKAVKEFNGNEKWQEYKNEVNVYFFKQADEIINNLNGK